MIPFLSHSKARLTAAFERTILELREQVSILALANYFHLRWHTVKDIEKRHLEQRFATIDTSKVRAVGIDEIHGICLSDNAASRRVLLKCGFVPVFEGVGDYQGEEREIFRSVWHSSTQKAGLSAPTA